MCLAMDEVMGIGMTMDEVMGISMAMAEVMGIGMDEVMAWPWMR